MNQTSRLTRARALEIASLDRSSTRRRLGQFRIEGFRAVESAVRADAPLVEITVRHDLADDERLGFLSRASCPIHRVESKTASKLSAVVQDQGILAVAEIRPAGNDRLVETTRTVILDGIQDPGNVGTIVRCAAWFGFEAVVAGPGTADFYNPKTVRSMAGSLWDVRLVQPDNLPETLGILVDAGFQLVGADLNGQPLSSWTPGPKVALVLGSEAHGLSTDASRFVDQRVRIGGSQQKGSGVESLNVAVAGGILMHRIGG